MKDLGEIQYCLGIQISRNRKSRTIFMNQKKYIMKVIERFGMAECKPIGTPMEPNKKLTKEMCPKTEEERNYMKKIPYTVGALWGV